MGTQNENLRTLELFAGAGGGVLGGLLLGHKPVCYVEREKYCQRILAQRMDDGILPDAPIWDDVRTFDGHPWRGRVDLVCGGFPCQNISVAGGGEGLNGSQSGLWGEMARIVREVRPRFVFVENSPALTSRGIHTVLGDLAALGFDAEWCVLGARDVGAPHRRDRIWILAYANKERRKERDLSTSLCEPGQPPRGNPSEGGPVNPSWWKAEPDLGGMASRVADQLDRIRALGNGQVPAVAAAAWQILINRIEV